MKLVIDTNVFIAGLLKDGLIRSLLLDSEHIFYVPEYILEEIIEHKKELQEKAQLEDGAFQEVCNKLVQAMQVIAVATAVPYREQAHQIMGHIDSDDVQVIASALAEDIAIWSDDKHFKQQNVVKVYTTKELKELL